MHPNLDGPFFRSTWGQEDLRGFLTVPLVEARYPHRFHNILREQLRVSLLSASVLEVEYRRLLALAAATGGRIAPPRLLSRIWTLHWTMFRAEYETFCALAVGRTIVPPAHVLDPTSASQTLGADITGTAALYRSMFGCPPVATVWDIPDPRRDRWAAFLFGAALSLMGLALLVSSPAIGLAATALLVPAIGLGCLGHVVIAEDEIDAVEYGGA